MVTRTLEPLNGNEESSAADLDDIVLESVVVGGGRGNDAGIVPPPLKFAVELQNVFGDAAGKGIIVRRDERDFHRTVSGLSGCHTGAKQNPLFGIVPDPMFHARSNFSTAARVSFCKSPVRSNSSGGSMTTAHLLLSSRRLNARINGALNLTAEHGRAVGQLGGCAKKINNRSGVRRVQINREPKNRARPQFFEQHASRRIRGNEFDALRRALSA